MYSYPRSCAFCFISIAKILLEKAYNAKQNPNKEIVYVSGLDNKEILKMGINKWMLGERALVKKFEITIMVLLELEVAYLC